MDPEENQDQEKQQNSTGGINIGDVRNLIKGKPPIPTGGLPPEPDLRQQVEPPLWPQRLLNGLSPEF
jgi:hypothetical protein